MRTGAAHLLPFRRFAASAGGYDGFGGVAGSLEHLRLNKVVRDRPAHRYPAYGAGGAFGAGGGVVFGVRLFILCRLAAVAIQIVRFRVAVHASVVIIYVGALTAVHDIRRCIHRIQQPRQQHRRQGRQEKPHLHKSSSFSWSGGSQDQYTGCGRKKQGNL